MYFLSFSLEKEKERKYQRKEKKPIVFLLFLFYCGRRYLFARAVKYGARETVRCFFRAFWYGDGLRINAALVLARRKNSCGLVLLKQRYLFARAVKYGARETVRRFFLRFGTAGGYISIRL